METHDSLRAFRLACKSKRRLEASDYKELDEKSELESFVFTIARYIAIGANNPLCSSHRPAIKKNVTESPKIRKYVTVTSDKVLMAFSLIKDDELETEIAFVTLVICKIYCF